MKLNKNNIISGIIGVALGLALFYSWCYLFDTKSEMKMGTSDHLGMGGMMMDMTMSDMVKMMDGKTGKALEKEFITGMIPHHKGAVEMAKKLLQDKTVSLELRFFAENIIKAQDAEIIQMGEWLKKY